MSQIRSWINQDPDPLLRGTDPGIRICTKMSRISNTGKKCNLIVICFHERVPFIFNLLSLISSLDECLPCGRPDIRARKTAHHIADRQNLQLTLGLRLSPPPSKTALFTRVQRRK
jgi:hypothetical protein